MRIVRQIVGGALFAVATLLAVAAIVGAIIALFGGMLGLESLRSAGGAVAGLGAIGFFLLLFSPLGEMVSYIGASSAKRPDQAGT